MGQVNGKMNPDDKFSTNCDEDWHFCFNKNCKSTKKYNFRSVLETCHICNGYVCSCVSPVYNSDLVPEYLNTEYQPEIKRHKNIHNDKEYGETSSRTIDSNNNGLCANKYSESINTSKGKKKYCSKLSDDLCNSKTIQNTCIYDSGKSDLSECMKHRNKLKAKMDKCMHNNYTTSSSNIFNLDDSEYKIALRESRKEYLDRERLTRNNLDKSFIIKYDKTTQTNECNCPHCNKCVRRSNNINATSYPSTSSDIYSCD